MNTLVRVALFVGLLGLLMTTRSTAQVPGNLQPGGKGKLTPEQIEKFKGKLSPEQLEKFKDRLMQGKQPATPAQPGKPAEPNPANPKNAGGFQPGMLKGISEEERMAKFQEMVKQRDVANSVPPSDARVKALVSSSKTVPTKQDADSKPLPKLTPTSAASTATELNQRLRDELKLPAISPNDVVNEQLYLRRVYLDLIGRAPSPEELTAFALDSNPQKRTQVVDKLLADSAYGKNWGQYWRDVVMYRKSEDRAQIVARPLQDYLAKEFNNNTPWNEIAQQFMTAEGTIVENGDTAIFMAQMGDTEDITSEMSRIFLGIQMQCAQCHDHPTDRWKREQFHELAAFFPRNTVRPGPMGDIFDFTLVSVNSEFRFRGPDNNRPRGSLEHYMSDLKDPTARGTAMEPVFFVTGKQLPHGATDLERRTVAAQWFTGQDNPWFARAIVNRMWSELTGEGFYEPVDDIGPDRQATAPQTLDYLAAQFQANKYDLKWLFRTITATEAYQRVSKSRRTPDQPAFMANVAQPLRSDQLYTQILMVLGIADQASPAMTGRGAALRDPRNQFNTMFGFDPSTRRDEITSSIPQSLAMMNGQANSGISGTRTGSVLERILRQNPDNRDAILELYLRCLSREPTSQEQAVALTHVERNSSRATGFEDLFWALLNSAEFHHRR